MKVVFKHEVNRIKSGFAARIPTLRLAAHGQSPELAARNLERTVLLFLRPFERAGTLERELENAGLEAQVDGDELTVEATA